MADSPLRRDPSGAAALGGTGETSGEVTPILADDTSQSLRVANLVWNTATLAWERMKQPTVELTGDLTVSMGDVEALLAGNYWKESLFDWTSGNLDYMGLNVVLGAAEAAATWYVFKFSWTLGNITRCQGPIVGSWTGRAAMGW